MKFAYQLTNRSLSGFLLRRTQFRGHFKTHGVMEDDSNWFTRSSTWIKRSPLILGGSGFVFVLLNRLSYGGAVGLDFGTATSRADVLCLVTSSILVLTGLNWISIQERELTTMELIGKEVVYINQELEESLSGELQWCWSALHEATRMDGLMLFHMNRGIFYRGISSKEQEQVMNMKPGEIVQNLVSSCKAVYIPKLSIYPGSIEFFQYFPIGTQSVIIQPLGSSGAIVLSSATERAFGKLDQAWISVIAEKLSAAFDEELVLSPVKITNKNSNIG